MDHCCHPASINREIFFAKLYCYCRGIESNRCAEVHHTQIHEQPTRLLAQFIQRELYHDEDQIISTSRSALRQNTSLTYCCVLFPDGKGRSSAS